MFLSGHKSRIQKFAISAASLAGAAILVQLIPVLATPLLAHLYTPEQFGTQATFAALVAAIVLPATLRYEQSIPLPIRRLTANRLTVFALQLGLASTVLSIAAVGFFHSEISQLIGDPEIGTLLWLLPASVAFVVVAQCITPWLIRNGEFGIMAVSRAGQSLVGTTCQGVFGFGGIASGMVLGSLVGQTLTAIFFGSSLWWRSKLRLRLTPIGWPRHEARLYSDFPMYSLPEAILGQLQGPMLVLIVTSFFSPAATGLLLLGQRIAMTPSSLLIQSTAPIWFQRFTEVADKPAKFRSNLLQAWLYNARVAIPLYLVLIVGTHLGLPLLFKPEWLGVIDIIDRLAFLGVFQGILGPTNSISVVLRRQHLSLSWAAMSVGAKVIVITMATGHDYLWLISWFMCVDIVSLVSFNLLLVTVLGKQSKSS